MIRTPKQNLRKPKTNIILPNRLKYRKVLLLRKDMEIEDLVNMAKPREEELLEIIEPLIPAPIKGDDGLTPTDEELIALIEPRIPAPIKGDKGENGKDGRTPTKTEIKGIIKEVLPEEKIVEKVLKKVKPGEKGDKGDKGEKGDPLKFSDLTVYEKQVLTGPQGSNGVGVPRGGTVNQVLAKSSSRDFDTEWVTGGGGGGAVDSVNGQTGVVVLDQDDIGDGTTYKQYSATEKTKLAGIETGAEVNTIDTVSDTTEIDLAITARDLTATIRAGSIDESKLDTSVNTSLDLADTALQSSAIGVSVQAYSSVLQNTTASFTTTDETKLDNITVTQAVNLDTMESDIAALANGMVYKGNWDASAGTFPGGGSAETGWFYTVSVGGTVDSVVFNVDDRLIATTDNASTTIYAGNWTQLDATDAVTSVFSRTGNVVATNGDYTASNITNVPAGNIAATDVQAALNELDTEKVPYTGATADLNLGTHDIVTDTARASTSAGLLVESANGTDVGLLGAGNTANIAWYGNHNFDTATQDTIAGFTGAGKTLGSLATATYPSLTELSYVKGVTSAIQTQLDGKVDENGAITGATKTKITYDAKGLVTAGADATTADIADSTNKRYVTDADLTDIGNLSGTNTGDQTITNSSDATSHTVTLSASGGSVQLIEGTGVTLTTGGTASAGTVTIAASGGSGATTALDNLAAVAINTSLISDTDNTDNLGSSLIRWATGFFTNLGATGTRIVKGWFTDIESTNMPTVGGTPILSSLTAPSFTTVELGAGGATDTTLSRASAGQLAVEGVNVLMNGGALGTPSSGTVTNLTGTASININGTVGATTPTTGTFTTAQVNTGLVPDANDGAYLGQSGTAFSDLFLADGGVVNWNAGNATLTHSTGLLTSNVDIVVPAEAYSSSWNGSNEAPTKNDVYDKIETLSSIKNTMSTDFAASTRYSAAVNGSGSNTYTTNGLVQTTGGTGTSSARIDWGVGQGNNGKIFGDSPLFSTTFFFTGDSANTGSAYVGLGQVTVDGSGHTFTDVHAGFKITTSGGVSTLSATQSGGTESATSLTTLANNDAIELIMKINGSSSIDYYYRKNGGALSSATNISTNMPSTTEATGTIRVSVSNNATANSFAWRLSGLTYTR